MHRLLCLQKLLNLVLLLLLLLLLTRVLAWLQGVCDCSRRHVPWCLMEGRGRCHQGGEGRKRPLRLPAQEEQQAAALRCGGAGCSLSWMPPEGCCGAAALGSLRHGRAGRVGR